jgi:aldehyde dehydrogenase (NAD+)
MAATAEVSESVRSAIAESARGHWIGGEWVHPTTEKTFDSVNPSTGENLVVLNEAGDEDIDRAVGSARTAFEGSWGRMSPTERQNIIFSLADLLEAQARNLGLLDTVGHGRASFDEQYWRHCTQGLTRPRIRFRMRARRPN